MSYKSKVSIVPTQFKETFVGKTFVGSKMCTEFMLLINFRTKITVEVVNSRFSRKKVISLNGDEITEFHKTSTSDLHYSWSYLMEGEQLHLRVEPNKGGTGSDLKINDVDFFDYVYAIEDDGPDTVRNLVKGSNTNMKFRVPPHSPRVIAQKEAERTPPRATEPSRHKLQVAEPKRDLPPAQSLIPSFPAAKSSTNYAKLEESDDEDGRIETRNDLIRF